MRCLSNAPDVTDSFRSIVRFRRAPDPRPRRRNGREQSGSRSRDSAGLAATASRGSRCDRVARCGRVGRCPRRAGCRGDVSGLRHALRRRGSHGTGDHRHDPVRTIRRFAQAVAAGAGVRRAVQRDRLRSVHPDVPRRGRLHRRTDGEYIHIPVDPVAHGAARGICRLRRARSARRPAARAYRAHHRSRHRDGRRGLRRDPADAHLRRVAATALAGRPVPHRHLPCARSRRRIVGEHAGDAAAPRRAYRGRRLADGSDGRAAHRGVAQRVRRRAL